MLKSTLIAASAYLMVSAPVQAGLQVRFIEGAPKDMFVLTNTGACDVVASDVSIDLSASAGRLIFDVTGAGAGVNVFQPVDFVEGAEALQELPLVEDGQTSVDLKIQSLAAGQNIAFTVDVDDTIGQREITVSGSEIVGAVLSFKTGSEELSGVFSSDALAEVQTGTC